ncbi:unnamed protein product, partial [Sphacelaria rigidula]
MMVMMLLAGGRQSVLAPPLHTVLTTATTLVLVLLCSSRCYACASTEVGDFQSIEAHEPSDNTAREHDTQLSRAGAHGQQYGEDMFVEPAPGYYAESRGLEAQMEVDTGEVDDGEEGSFLNLALARFAERAGRRATKADQEWTFPHIQ